PLFHELIPVPPPLLLAGALVERSQREPCPEIQEDRPDRAAQGTHNGFGPPCGFERLLVLLEREIQLQLRDLEERRHEWVGRMRGGVGFLIQVIPRKRRRPAGPSLQRQRPT